MNTGIPPVPLSATNIAPRIAEVNTIWSQAGVSFAVTNVVSEFAPKLGFVKPIFNLSYIAKTGTVQELSDKVFYLNNDPNTIDVYIMGSIVPPPTKSWPAGVTVNPHLTSSGVKPGIAILVGTINCARIGSLHSG
jgi:hypothetical protein